MFPDLLDGGAWIDSLVTETPRPGQQRDQVRKLTGGFPMGQSTSGTSCPVSTLLSPSPARPPSRLTSPAAGEEPPFRRLLLASVA
ncbi:UNVERIFIED_CONTAM: hypothetical protein K2H54_024364 [Gekko kuhli]